MKSNISNSGQRLLDVTAVVCTWNAISSIRDCLLSLKGNTIKEIIVVDGGSIDGTREIAAKLADKLLDDPRQGLALARNIGIEKCQTEFVINVGADNLMPPGSIQSMLATLKDKNWSGVSATTLIKDPRKNYCSWAMNHYKISRFYPGERTVIGTPTLFLTRLLKENPYDPKMSWSDDGDLCTRLCKKGHHLGIADVTVYEVGTENFHSIYTRWQGYGKSDWEIYSKYAPTWSISRKFCSIAYPLVNELAKPFIKIPGITRFCVLPFLFVITLFRYASWIRFALKSISKYRNNNAYRFPYMNQHILEGSRLTLKPVTIADVSNKYVNWMNDPEVNKFLESRHEHQTIDSVKAYVVSFEGNEQKYLFGIFTKPGNRHIGNISFSNVNKVHGYGIIGICIGDKTFWRKGYGIEALSLIMGYGFRVLKLRRIEAWAYANNIASINLFQKAGFTIEGSFKKRYRYGDCYVDGILLGMINPA